MCFAQGPQRNDASEARARGLSVSSQALYHYATAHLSPSIRYQLALLNTPGKRQSKNVINNRRTRIKNQ